MKPHNRVAWEIMRETDESPRRFVGGLVLVLLVLVLVWWVV